MRETSLRSALDRPKGAGVDRVLELARQHLGMDVAFLAQFTEGKQVYRGLDGDSESFGWMLNDGPSLPDTYCRLMTKGEIPNAIPDAKNTAAVKDLIVTQAADIGSYVGVPVRLGDGSLYGSFCCLSHEATPLHERDVKFMALLAELVAEEVEAQLRLTSARERICSLVDDRRVEIAVQPVVSLRTGELLGVEALSRFPGDYGTPDVVFNAAYEAGLGPEMERVAAGEAFGLLPHLGPGQYLALNLMPPAAFELAERAALVAGMPYDQLVLEITEHAAVDNYEALRRTLQPAREQGLRLAIDDAGAGYASLHHIVELSPDIVKIDRSLVNGLSGSEGRRSVVRAFVMLARDLGAVVIAEGVEDVADLEVAFELDVDAAQGYLLARPTTDRDELNQWVSSGVPLPPTFGG